MVPYNFVESATNSILIRRMKRNLDTSMSKRTLSHNALFLWGLPSHSRIFHLYGDVTITKGEGDCTFGLFLALMPLSSQGT